MGKKRLQQPVIDPSLSIKAVTKGSVWAISENDVIRMWKEATRDAEVKKNVNHYLDIFKSAFIIEEIKEGGFYEKKVKDGYEVLEVEKGGWVEAIFAKRKPELADAEINSSDNE